MMKMNKSPHYFIRKFFNRYLEKSFALQNLDKKLALYINLENGFFVEAGANDGVSQSNTLFFEKYLGWSGLLVEPIPELAQKCKKNRPNTIVEECALVAFGFPKDQIEMKYCNLESIVNDGTIDKEILSRHLEFGRNHLKKNEEVYSISVPVFNLSYLLDRNNIKKVDFLSLDVEGYECEVLKGIDFQRHRPKYMLIEVRSQPEIEDIINPLYNQVAILSMNTYYKDILYVSKET